jgi:hypothetical protein
VGDDLTGAEEGKSWEMPVQILCVFIGCLVVYSLLFSIGSFVYQQPLLGILLAAIASAGAIFLFKSFSKLRAD